VVLLFFITLYPGQSVTVEILLNSKKGVGVPTAALIKRNNGWVVFTIADGRAKEVPVKIGLEDGKWTQLIDPSLKTGDSIVSMGQFLLKDNTKVLVQN
jgi:multidrug efflux pump subunit AcrA (membrane-fusion protein)